MNNVIGCNSHHSLTGRDAMYSVRCHRDLRTLHVASLLVRLASDWTETTPHLIANVGNNYELRVMNYELRVMNYELRVIFILCRAQMIEGEAH